MAASSDNLAANIDPFLLRHSFADYFWPTPADNDSFSKSIYDDHDFNTLLLQPHHHQQQPDYHHQYLSQQQQQQYQSLSPFSSSDLDQNQHKPITTTHPHPLTPSSDPETSTTPKRRAAATVALNLKPRITKRKSRATKKNQTTFITADPANFRQMVQQVTGIRFDSTSSSSSTLSSSLSHFLKPEIRRPVGRLYNACLPTLDTSSFLLGQSQSLIGDRSFNGAGGLNSVGFGAQSGNGGESSYGASDGFACFPTLESWKVM